MVLFYFFEAVLRITRENVTKNCMIKHMYLCRENFLFGTQWVGTVVCSMC